MIMIIFWAIVVYDNLSESLDLENVQYKCCIQHTLNQTAVSGGSEVS